MKKIIFLPAWYQDIILKRQRSIYRNSAILLCIINILLIILFLKATSTINDIDDKRAALAAAQNDKIKAESQNKSGELQALNYFVSDFSGLSFTSIKIENKKISFETNIKDKSSYCQIIKLIEDKKKYKILSVLKTEDESLGLKLKISIEVVV